MNCFSELSSRLRGVWPAAQAVLVREEKRGTPRGTGDFFGAWPRAGDLSCLFCYETKKNFFLLWNILSIQKTVDIYALPRFCRCEQCCLIYFGSLSFLKKEIIYRYGIPSPPLHPWPQEPLCFFTFTMHVCICKQYISMVILSINFYIHDILLVCFSN